MNLVILHHLGLGDHWICNGLLRVKAKDYENVVVPCKAHNADTVAWMFSDLPNVKAFAVTDDSAARRYANFCENQGVVKVLRLGVHSGNNNIPSKWAEWLYAGAGVPFECRWSEFKLPSVDPRITFCHPGIFWHDDLKRGYCINLGAPAHHVYKPSPSEPMENHILPLSFAEEIHVIDSSFLCLADSIETSAKRHVLHLYATAHDPYKKLGPPTLRKNWEILR